MKNLILIALFAFSTTPSFAAAPITCHTFSGGGFTLQISPSNRQAHLSGNGINEGLKRDARSSAGEDRNGFPSFTDSSDNHYSVMVSDKTAELTYYNYDKTPVAGWDNGPALQCAE